MYWRGSQKYNTEILYLENAITITCLKPVYGFEGG